MAWRPSHDAAPRTQAFVLANLEPVELWPRKLNTNTRLDRLQIASLVVRKTVIE